MVLSLPTSEAGDNGNTTIRTSCSHVDITQALLTLLVVGGGDTLEPRTFPGPH